MQHGASPTGPPDSLRELARLRAARPRLLRRFDAQARRGDPGAASTLLALDPVMILDAPPARYAPLLERAVQLAPEGDPGVHVRLLHAHARAWTLRGGRRIARDAVAQARALEVGGALSLPITTALLGFTALAACLKLGACAEVDAEARALADRARTAAREPGALRIAALAAQATGLVAVMRGAYGEAIAHFDATIDLARRAGLDRTLAIALANRGLCLDEQDEPDRATVAYQQSLTLFEQLDDRVHATHVEGSLLLRASRRGAALDPDRVLPAVDRAERCGNLCTAIELLLALVEHAPRHASPAASAPLLDRAWSLLARVDAPELEAKARRLTDARGRVDADALAVAADGTFARLGERAIDLAHRKALPGVLRALVATRIDRPGEPLDVAALFAAGWPGEKALHHAASARVYMAVSALRTLGLRGAITSSPAGYRVDPAVRTGWI